ncbi:MAG: extracellular solute-binding protein [Hyphomicrobiales bacterium]
MMRFAAAATALLLVAIPVSAQPRHGISAFGDLKYPADFTHFDYVNPNAPKGGKIATIGVVARDTFDSFNDFILKGDPAQGLGLLFDTLMERANDEPDAMYGLVAKTADLAADKKSITFQLREEAKFSDGTAVTAEDVCETFRLIMEHGHERLRMTIRDAERCEVLGPHEARFIFKTSDNRDLPLSIAALPVLSKTYYSTHDFAKADLQPPLGSGPYKIGSFKPAEYVAYERRDDYWAKDLPVNRGRYNFDEIRYEYFRDRKAQFEALKAGILDIREEYTSRDWQTAYDFPAVKDGRVLKTELPDETPSGAQGFFFNLRRDKFQDVRVRQALNLAFDFEWTNANLFYGLYDRTASFFEKSALKAEGAPSPDELVLLEPLRGKLRPEVFGEIALPQKSDGSGQDRKMLRAASALLDQAGWTLDGNVRRNAKGEPLEIEVLIDDPVFERVFAPYVRNLKLLGIDARLRMVDPVQYEQRQKNFDFDIVSARFSTGVTPGSELRIFFGSDSAKAPGSYNLSGVANPEIDALIEKVVTAKSREELDTAGRALDRVLRSEWFWVPNWYKASYWIAQWDKYGRPAVQPKYDRGIIDTWWYDPEKAAKIAKAN